MIIDFARLGGFTKFDFTPGGGCAAGILQRIESGGGVAAMVEGVEVVKYSSGGEHNTYIYQATETQEYSLRV